MSVRSKTGKARCPACQRRVDGTLLWPSEGHGFSFTMSAHRGCTDDAFIVTDWRLWPEWTLEALED